jgi:hypothetical protein
MAVVKTRGVTSETIAEDHIEISLMNSFDLVSILPLLTLRNIFLFHPHKTN